MNITVNGDDVRIDAQTTVTGLLAQLGIAEKGIAVAVDWAVVPRSRWDTELSEGMRVDVVAAVQGG